MYTTVKYCLSYISKFFRDKWRDMKKTFSLILSIHMTYI